MKRDRIWWGWRTPLLLLTLFGTLLHQTGGQDVNVSVAATEATDQSINFSFDRLILLEEKLTVFDIKRIANGWSTLRSRLSGRCGDQMTQYLQGLQTEKLWALKMDDSSGKYTKGFFWGNNYWTGSMDQCSYIYQNDSGADPAPKKKGRNTDITYINGNFLGSSELEHQNPPFVPGFYMAKILINGTESFNAIRTVVVGLCLPSGCSIADVETLLKLDISVRHVEQELVGVRSPTLNNFSLWDDFTFRILFIFSVIVVILLISGTGYDLVLRRRYKAKMRIKSYCKELTGDMTNGLGCTTYDLTHREPEENGKGNCTVIRVPTSVNNNNSDENLAVELTATEETKLSKFRPVGSLSWIVSVSCICVRKRKPESPNAGLWAELLLSFSVVTNFKAICDKNVGNDTIPSIHGLRAISMAWVILGHTMIVVFKYSDNMELRKVVEKEFLFQIVLNGAYSVDTFFFISGFLVSFIYFRTNAKGKLEKLTKGVSEFTAGTFHFFGLVGYRFVRLTAPYLYVLGVVEVVMRYLEQNSVFEPPTQDHVNCPKYWWRNILYINTLFPVEQMCMLWSWYLADDTQFYIIGALILIIAVRHFKFAATMMSVFMVSAWATTAYIAFSNNHMPDADDPFALFDKIYDKPWTRLGPYLVGMSVGWILFKTNCKIKMSLLTVISGWVTSTMMMLYLLFGLYNTTLTQTAAAAYSSLSHTGWAIGCGWVIVACSSGYGGWVNKLLSTPILYPFSRVTYCAYLVHPIINRIFALESDSPIHMTPNALTTVYLGQVVSSYVLAFIISLSFEAPVVTMLKILSPNRKKRI
uniref:NRF domain-containing protein n=1 Tax=Anopheles funestus TaxID=62324 RepID=A0A182R512_ANOFN